MTIEGIAKGLATTKKITVDEPRTIDFMGPESRVYATPELVRDIEMTCRDLLLGQIDNGQDSVGTRVNVDHLAATPLGMWVEITATVVERNGRKVTFGIECRDAVEQVARGTHERFIVDVEKTAARIVKKRASG